jgi:hypothetical protein
MGILSQLALGAKAALGLYVPAPANNPGGQLLAGVFPGSVGSPPSRGTREAEQAYVTAALVRTFTGRISDDVAMNEWEMLRTARASTAAGRASQGLRVRALQASADPRWRAKGIQQMLEAGDLEPLPSHPVLDVLQAGNAGMTGLAVRKLMQLYMDLAGESFMLKERGPGRRVVGLWPIPPSWVVNSPTQQARTYRISYRGYQRTVPTEDLLALTDPSPVNPYGRGSGIVGALGQELDTSEYVVKHLLSWFFNRARPDLLVTGPLGGPENVARFEQAWVNKNMGPMRGFKPMFLDTDGGEGKVAVHEFDQDFRSQQVQQIYALLRDAVRQSFGMPPEIMGDVSNSNRSTIDAADVIYSRYVLVPRLERLRDGLQKWLVDEWADEGLILNYHNPVPEDKEFKLRAMTGLPQNWDVDEHRSAVGGEPLPGDKGKGVFWVSGAIKTQLLDTLDEPPPEVPAALAGAALSPGGEGNAPGPPTAPQRPQDATSDEGKGVDSPRKGNGEPGGAWDLTRYTDEELVTLRAWAARQEAA